jgi:hypothetical protein
MVNTADMSTPRRASPRASWGYMGGRHCPNDEAEEDMLARQPGHEMMDDGDDIDGKYRREKQGNCL